MSTLDFSTFLWAELGTIGVTRVLVSCWSVPTFSMNSCFRADEVVTLNIRLKGDKIAIFSTWYIGFPVISCLRQVRELEHSYLPPWKVLLLHFQDMKRFCKSDSHFHLRPRLRGLFSLMQRIRNWRVRLASAGPNFTTELFCLPNKSTEINLQER